ncbi:hypothetical protein AB0M39_37855 [Streptomyces sp. NPDC051907]|uniref:hypothetical protein n=1 Tax=Streptomyces sp. NPDC051907 TaxID=3155284 RepID=UPI00343F12AB
MICPHCERSLLRKERPNNTCSLCKRSYALDPKTNPLRLNDLRVRRIMAKLTAEGTIKVTPGQLWYALSRKRLKESEFAAGSAGTALVAGIVAAFFAVVGDFAFLFAVCGGLLLLSLGLFLARKAGVGRGVPPTSREAFRSQALAEWRKVYGRLPQGMVDDDAYPRRRRQDHTPDSGGAPACVLLCPDRSIAVFLAADGLPDRYGIALAQDLEQVLALGSQGPVIVLHDADASGVLLVHQARAALRGRPVIDAGLPLRTVRGLPQAVPYRAKGEKPDAQTVKQLAALGELTAQELKQLGRGWRFPLVGMPPARLLAVVAQIAEQVARRADPERRRAASVGFMTWPGTGTATASGPAGER